MMLLNGARLMSVLLFLVVCYSVEGGYEGVYEEFNNSSTTTLVVAENDIRSQRLVKFKSTPKAEAFWYDNSTICLNFETPCDVKSISLELQAAVFITLRAFVLSEDGELLQLPSIFLSALVFDQALNHNISLGSVAVMEISTENSTKSPLSSVLRSLQVDVSQVERSLDNSTTVFDQNFHSPDEKAASQRKPIMENNVKQVGQEENTPSVTQRRHPGCMYHCISSSQQPSILPCMRLCSSMG